MHQKEFMVHINFVVFGTRENPFIFVEIIKDKYEKNSQFKIKENSALTSPSKHVIIATIPNPLKVVRILYF